MPWRYQPVWIEEDGGNVFGMCEVYFDAEGRFYAWTEAFALAPGGDTLEELQQNIAQMMGDAYKWRPVKFSELCPGMTFERAISQDVAEELADEIDGYGETFAEAVRKGLS